MLNYLRRIRSFLFLFAFVSFSILGADSTRRELSTQHDAIQLNDEILEKLNALPAGSSAPGVLVIHPEHGEWGRLHNDLVTLFSRHGLPVSGMLLESTDLDDSKREKLVEAIRPYGSVLELTINDQEPIEGQVNRQIANYFGISLISEHYRQLKARSLPDQAFRFRWVKNIPRGFGGRGLKQVKYLYVGAMNTFAFYLSKPGEPGLAEMLCFALTYAFNAASDHLHYFRMLSRKPRWEKDPRTGQTNLNVDQNQTFSRGFFFVVTWGVVLASNAIIVSPIAVVTGKYGPLLFRIFSNSLLNVFSFAWVEALFARARKRQLEEESRANDLRVAAASVDFQIDQDRVQELLAEALEHESSAKTAERIHSWGRTGYYGTIHPFFKNPNLVGSGPSIWFLVAMGTAGLFIDVWNNGQRLYALAKRKVRLETSAATGSEKSDCRTIVVAGDRDALQLIMESLRAP